MAPEESLQEILQVVTSFCHSLVRYYVKLFLFSYFINTC